MSEGMGHERENKVTVDSQEGIKENTEEGEQL
jgi:hypothetical protein